MKAIKSVVKTTHQGDIYYQRDPMTFLLEKNLAVQVGDGLFVLQGILVEILTKIEKLICNIADEVTAKEVFVPSILSYENTKKSKYLNSFKNQALMLKPYHQPHQEYVAMASPTVCYHYFSSVKNTSISKNLIITAISKCSRREKGKLNNLGRLTNFTMREIVFLGSEKYCLKKRKEILQLTEKMLRSFLGLSYQTVTAADPFFGSESEMKKNAQLLSEAKYEIQILIPFNQGYLSIASFNHHGQVFFDRFSISSKSRSVSFSGCVGFGYERILYSILAQKGVDFTTAYYQKLLK